MPAHFLLSSAARTLTLASVARMSDEEAERVFVRLRWADNHGDAYCPHCGCPIVYACRRPNGAPRWRCKACRKDFSVTSGTLFAFHKMPLRSYLARHRDLLQRGQGQVACWRSPAIWTCNTRRPSCWRTRCGRRWRPRCKGARVGGQAKRRKSMAAISAATSSRRTIARTARDRRFGRTRSGKRKVVVVIRERDGQTLPARLQVGSRGAQFHPHPRRAADRAYADEAGSWNELHARFTMHRINHQRPTACPAASTRMAPRMFFCRMRRAEIGHHHHIAGPYLIRFAQEASWREDHRREANGEQVDRLVGARDGKPAER